MRIARGGSASHDIEARVSSRGGARTVALVCHPDTPSTAVQGIEARVARTRHTALTLTYTATGDLSRVRMPAPRAPGISERLWQHTCFEAFIGVKGEAAYHELNFAPSRAWTVYAFDRYREGAALADEALEPHIDVRTDAGELMLEATVSLDRLSHRPGSTLTLGLTAVIEDTDGMLSYWALGHPPGKPDFHHRHGFALELDEARD